MEGLAGVKVSEDKKRYIVELLNPVLEEMVAECIHRMPEDPVPFMLDWLEAKKVSDEDKLLSCQEKESIEEDSKCLEAKITNAKKQMQEAAKHAADADGEEEEEEDDDDEEEEPPEGWIQSHSKAPRTSVSAEAYGEWNARKAFVAPVISKTDEQKDRLKKCLVKSFLFSSLDANDLGIVIGAMKEVVAEAVQRLINQGDAGDFLFVVESGKLDCIKDGTVVKTCMTGDVFGELALLYNNPRAASVEAQEKSILWQLDRDTFGHIVKQAASKKRARYDAFLCKVPLLASMDDYERSQLADALKSETFTDGATVVTQGEVGAKFYIIEEGEAVATKDGQQVMRYAVGDYFGELALIRNQPRAATVKCKDAGMVKLLSLDSASFKRLLNVQDLLDRTKKYETTPNRTKT